MLSGWAVAVGRFPVIAGPYIGLMSHVKGRFTTGDSAKLNVDLEVNGVRVTNARGQPDGEGHGSASDAPVFGNPRIFEFGKPIGGTYPPWFNPVLSGMKESASVAHLKAFCGQALLLVGVAVSILVSPAADDNDRWTSDLVTAGLVPGNWSPKILGDWPFLVLAVFPFLMYGMLRWSPDMFNRRFAHVLWTGLLRHSARRFQRDSIARDRSCGHSL